MKILVTGGAGYIGSCMVRLLQELKHEIVVIDNFSSGNKWAVSDCDILEVDLQDYSQLEKSIINYHFDGVIHFAGSSIVSESIKFPEKYFENNLKATQNLLEVIVKNKISKNFVFSSTAAVYGEPNTEIIDENHQRNPINPYGESKYMIEKMLKDFYKYHGISSISLRYFNASGAHYSGLIGEHHNPETHLIPNILEAVLKNKFFKIFGDSFETSDGTCVRDYVHIEDLAVAHLESLKYLLKNKVCESINLGSGKGFSVKQIIDEVETVTGLKVNYTVDKKREGDPARLVADITKAKNILGWIPKKSQINNIVSSAWNWHQKKSSII